eukprot:CAMPEP_0178552468 /NCGR_PEP_ID=MMETSP0697-20121206/7313_1 /TAXON_ID=265572 /ORGANISM="Extubocellulus spinifer, Strain CCMP396" /LENGTH=780 /DNA_ID=CAMNT_0020185347 /DNA_START=96 /DNA_END=2435 /DNA_ORIENTATION=+
MAAAAAASAAPRPALPPAAAAVVILLSVLSCTPGGVCFVARVQRVSGFHLQVDLPSPIRARRDGMITNTIFSVSELGSHAKQEEDADLALDLDAELLSPTSSDDNTFIVAQYNVLAASLGYNTHPWFLHGLSDLSPARRASIQAKFYARDASTGRLLKKGWPDHALGILSEEEMSLVEDFHERYFAWDGRKDRLLRTVEGLDADLLSLVECDRYAEFWEVEMDRRGYGGVYEPRPRQGNGIDATSSNTTSVLDSDGCAIFYRRGVFELEASHGFRFDNMDVEATPSSGIPRSRSDGEDPTGAAPAPASRMTDSSDRVALFALLRHVATNRRLIFASTHLARNPEDSRKTQERARQVAQLLYQATVFAAEHGVLGAGGATVDVGSHSGGGGDEVQLLEGGEGEEAPLILAGDLNEVNIRHLATLARVKCGLAAMSCHPFLYTSRSASSLVPTTERAPYAPTSITSCRSFRIDYVLLQPSLFDVCRTVPVPLATNATRTDDGGGGEEEEEEECAMSDDDFIPNELHPSDHFPVAFKLRLRGWRSSAEGCAAYWAKTVIKANTNEANRAPTLAPPVSAVLRLEELDAAWEYFGGKEGGGIISIEQLRAGLEQILVTAFERSEFDEVLNNCLTEEGLEVDKFRAIYIQSWLRAQPCFRDRVRSVRTCFDLNVDSSELGSPLDGRDMDDLFAAIDADNNGDVSLEDVIVYLRYLERSEDSLRARVRDAFSFFDFDSSEALTLQDIYRRFDAVCPFEVSMEILQSAFDYANRSYDEEISFEEFIDW